MVGNRVHDSRARTFDVICAGEAFLDGGAINAAVALVRDGLRVGLATVVADETQGRALVARVAATGVDVGAVELAQPTRGLVFVRGGARQALATCDEAKPIAIPANWSAQVLLLSGMSPEVAHSAALCKAARAARRIGTTVVIDVNARWHVWQGRDARSVRMVLREADVVWCSAHDLFGLNMDLPSLRAALRPNAVLVVSDGARTASASGPFGEVTQVFERHDAASALGESDAFTTAICAELARAGGAAPVGESLWARALLRASSRRNDRSAWPANA